jgi:hypothetical protein
MDSDRVRVYHPQTGEPSEPLFHSDARDRVNLLGWTWEPPATDVREGDPPPPKKRAPRRRSAPAP